MSFTKELREQGDSIFEAIFNHPFILGIERGDLRSEQLVHYVKQDFQYLTVFCQVYGLAISKTHRRDYIEFFNDQIGFVLNTEIHPHRNFAEVAGVPLASLQQETQMAPTAYSYTRHMLYAAHSGSLARMLCALLPCPLTYWEIGLRLKPAIEREPEHPFKHWIDFYASPEIAGVNHRFAAMINELAEHESEPEREQMTRNFITSCRMEYSFWEMAFTLEDWAV